MDQQEIGPMVVEGPAFHGSDLPEPIVTQAPRLGEHTRPLRQFRDGGENLAVGDNDVATGRVRDCA